ncbi:MAG TPA: serpin family protein, partial [Gemmataceae bacterium]|nr:serpin family protein [Gemmataceae bacterium]
LIPQGSIDEMTRLVLTNAVYFKGTWEHQFKPTLTHNGDFHVPADETVQVPMMHQDSHFRYLRANGFQLLEMPYKGNDLAMIILLPQRVDGLADLESKLSADQLESWLAKARPNYVQVSLPRFKMTRELSLGNVLAGMGMPLAFNAQADFSGMDGQKDLHISAILHKAFVDVNEEGTEAAAATGAVMTLAAVPVRENFRADHPFVFLIRDNQSGSILFLGRVENPKKQEQP